MPLAPDPQPWQGRGYHQPHGSFAPLLGKETPLPPDPPAPGTGVQTLAQRQEQFGGKGHWAVGISGAGCCTPSPPAPLQTPGSSAAPQIPPHRSCPASDTWVWSQNHPLVTQPVPAPPPRTRTPCPGLPGLPQPLPEHPPSPTVPDTWVLTASSPTKVSPRTAPDSRNPRKRGWKRPRESHLAQPLLQAGPAPTAPSHPRLCLPGS